MGYQRAEASDSEIAETYISSLADWLLLAARCRRIVMPLNTGYSRTAAVYGLHAVWYFDNELAMRGRDAPEGEAPCYARAGAQREEFRGHPAGW
jgi:hypothetical protein